MSWIEQLGQVLGIAGTLLGGGGIGGYLIARVRSRAEVQRAQAEGQADEREAAASVRRTEVIHDERVAARLLERLGEQDHRIDALRDELRQQQADAEARCREELAEQQQRHDAQRQADRAECDRQLAAVREDVEKVARRVAQSLADRGEITGLHELEEVVRRSETPPGGWRREDLRADDTER